jgi:hypothetical protein
MKDKTEKNLTVAEQKLDSFILELQTAGRITPNQSERLLDHLYDVVFCAVADTAAGIRAEERKKRKNAQCF